MSENKVTRTQMMEYILKKIGLQDETLTYVAEEFGIKRADIIEGITKDKLMKINVEPGSLLKEAMQAWPEMAMSISAQVRFIQTNLVWLA